MTDIVKQKIPELNHLHILILQLQGPTYLWKLMNGSHCLSSSTLISDRDSVICEAESIANKFEIESWIRERQKYQPQRKKDHL